MDQSPNLGLPYILAAQAQKHVTHNEAVRTLDALVHLAVLDRDLAAPPASPADGDRYIVAQGASGAWSAHGGEIAVWQDGAWAFFAPREGWIAWIVDENAALAWDGSAWGGIASGSSSLQNVPLVGVNATADMTNRLSVAGPAALFNHEGAGHQLKINKAASTDTASLLFQDGFSGRAELGLAGSDDFKVKVSADGTAWHEAIVIDRSNGQVSFPNTSIGGGAGAASADIRLLFLYAAEARGDRLDMVDGIADAFADETDVDTAASTDESYDAANDRYAATQSADTTKNSTNHTTYSGTNGTAAASTEFSGTYPAWKAVDGSIASTNAWFTASGTTTGWWRYQFTAAQVIDKVTITANATSAQFTAMPKDFTIEGSNDATNWTVLATISGETGWTSQQARSWVFANTTAYTYYRINITANNGQTYAGFSEIALITTGTPQNMTLQSNAFAADAAPATARAGVQASILAGTLTINTDLMMDVSRDGGTTWTQATLALVESLADGTKYYEDESLDISAQPSGMSMKWRVRTANAKMIYVSAALLQWGV